MDRDQFADEWEQLRGPVKAKWIQEEYDTARELVEREFESMLADELQASQSRVAPWE